MSRVYRKRGNWNIDFNDAQGRRHRRKIGPSKRVADEALNAVLTRVARQEWVGAVDDSKISFSDFATKIWDPRVLPTLRPKTQTRWQGILNNHLKPAFSGALRAIDLGAVEKYVAERRQAGATPGTVNREVAVLRHIFKRACGWKDHEGCPYLRRYPLVDGDGAKWKGLQEPSGRTRFLDEDEIARLLAACEESRSAYLTPFVLVALNTGMRRGEILSLTRTSIDWKRLTAKLTGTKNGEDRVVNLNDTALEALKGLPVRIDGKLFPYADDAAVSRAFRRAVGRAELEDLRLHDLRHTFASHQAMNGTQGRGLQAMLGHKDGRMTQRYSHLSDDYLRNAVNAVQLGTRPATPTSARGAQGA